MRGTDAQLAAFAGKNVSCGSGVRSSQLSARSSPLASPSPPLRVRNIQIRANTCAQIRNWVAHGNKCTVTIAHWRTFRKKCKTSRELGIGMDLDSMDFMSASLGEKWMAASAEDPSPSQTIFECPTGREAWAEFEMDKTMQAAGTAKRRRQDLDTLYIRLLVGKLWYYNAIANWPWQPLNVTRIEAQRLTACVKIMSMEETLIGQLRGGEGQGELELGLGNSRCLRRELTARPPACPPASLPAAAWVPTSTTC